MIALDAKKYKNTGFEHAYFEAVYQHICKRMSYKTEHAAGKGRVAKELVWFLKEYNVLQYLPLGEVCDKPFNEFTEDDFNDIMKALILADPETLQAVCRFLEKEGRRYLDNMSNARDEAKGIKNKYAKEPFKFLDYFARNAYSAMRELEINMPQVSETRNRLPVLMVRILGVRTCPYCNRAYIGSRGNKILGVQLDHFHNKDKYPFLAVSLYNLIPCCSFCNTIKRNDDKAKLISPFDTKLSFDEDVKLSFEDAEGVSLKVSKADEKKEKRYKTNIKMFHLEDVYAFHAIEARRFNDKMRAYPPSLLGEIARHMNEPEKITAEALEMWLFHEYFCEPGDYIKKPLAKFYRDLYYRYRGWEV